MSNEELVQRSARENAAHAADLRSKDGPMPTPEGDRRGESYAAGLQLVEVRQQIAAVEKRGRENPNLDNKPTLLRLRLSAARLFDTAERNNDRGR